MARDNLGVCGKCGTFVPVEHVKRDGKVYLHKTCPECGVTEALVSTDSKQWQLKRDVWHYQAPGTPWCNLRCEECGYDHKPSMVFVDVTNRCNMNCPICIANIPAMGFKFEPPLDYFEKLFTGLTELAPGARINLFGGEPTVRDDLFEIINMAREKGFRPRIVTNGLRLANEDYCRKVAKAGVPLLFSLDGLGPEIYDRLRKNPGAFHKKMRALDNLKKLSVRRNTIMTCVARHINDHHMGDMIRFCHDNRGFIRAMHLIPLTETWEEGEFETDVATTSEDVERIIDEAVPEGRVEFWPAGLPARWGPALKFFGSPKLTFGGVHPNCESATMLLSDGEQFRAINHYTNRGLNEFAGEVTDVILQMQPKLDALDAGRFFQRLRGRLMLLRAFGPRFFRFLAWKKIMKGNPVLASLKILMGLAFGGKPKDVLRANTRIQDALRMVVLPFEEPHSVESQRLCTCKSSFAHLDVETDEVKLVPVCTWSIYKDDILRALADKHATAAREAQAATSSSS